MTYLHYNLSNENLSLLTERHHRKAEIAEIRHRKLRNKADRYWPHDVPKSLKRKMRDEHKRAIDASNTAERMEEERWWRKDRDAVIADYEKAGYVLRFLCGNEEFETEEEALAEAGALHMMNDHAQSKTVLTEIGSTTCLRQRTMVQAIFVLKEASGEV